MELQDMKYELSTINAKLKTIEDKEANSYTSRLSKSFHLGMVGGSGRNNHSLNKKREREFDRTIKQAHESTSLYTRRDELEKKITYIESGQKERDEVRKKSRAEILAQWFRDLKAGDTWQPGNYPVTITRVNKKSITTENGVKYTAYEVIGKEASLLL